MSGRFHAGEQALQAQAGTRDRLAEIAPQILREHMPDQHRELFGKLPTLLLAALDAQGQPWATMLAGTPGFVSTPDARTLLVEHARAAEDPALAALQTAGAPVGLLGLEPHTRRRNRMNGVLAQDWHEGEPLAIAVRQSFGNCPRYIVPRLPLARLPEPGRVEKLGPQLDEAARALIRRSDTLFIASASARPREQHAVGEEGLDVSHRGGPPGFLELEDGPTGLVLGLPDYPGNQFFMTLGNLSLNPAAGLLLVDYAQGGLLHLSARAEIVEAGEAGEEGRRRLRFHLREGVWRPGILPLRWQAVA